MVDEQRRSRTTSLASSSSSLNPIATDRVQLRPLPGFAPGSPPSDFLSSRLAGQQQNLDKPGSPFGRSSPLANPTMPTPSSKPYQSRERLYYQQEGIKVTSNVPLGNGADSKPSYQVKLTEAEIKADAPPIGSIYDDPMSPDRSYHRMPETERSNIKEIDHLAEAVAGYSQNRVLTESTLANAAFENYNGPVYINTSSTDPIDSWVTVFGFNGAQTQAVLNYFKTLGTVVKTELGQRNWLHIQFDSPWAAQKALLKNGTVLPSAGSCMIGVLPTRKAMEQVGLASASFMSPLKTSEIAPSTLTDALLHPQQHQKAKAASIPSSNEPPMTPGFPQGSLYTAGAIPPMAPTQPVITNIFASQASKESAAQAEASLAVGQEGLLTKAFNYIFGF